MPDIAMCSATTCGMSKTCYRHEDSGTKASERWQSWSAFPPSARGCDYYWPVSIRRRDMETRNEP